MITLLHNYIRTHNIVELSSYLIALLYILDAFTWNGQRIEIVEHGRYASSSLYFYLNNCLALKFLCFEDIQYALYKLSFLFLP